MTTWIPNDAEVSAVLARDPETRLAYFVKRVADRGELVGWEEEAGWLLLADDDGQDMVPVWPHARFAVAAMSAIPGHPARIELEEFVDQWLPQIDKEGRSVAVFPDVQGLSAVVSAHELAEALRQEVARFE